MPGVEENTHAMIEAQRKAAFPDAVQIQKYRDYAFGKHPITLSDNQKRALRGVLANQFCDNASKRIVATVAARVKVDRFDVADDAVEKFIKEVWTLNWFKQLQSRVHFSTVRDGNHAVSLGWDNIARRVSMRRELWWNGKSGVFIAYDGTGQPEYAVKEWQTKTIKDNTLIDAKRRTVWFPNRIERFIESGDGWQWFTLPAQLDSAGNIVRDAETPGAQPWTENGKPNGKALGIPVVHFARMAQPSDIDCDLTGLTDFYGDSILANVLGNQDVINDLHMSLLAAARYTAYQKYTASGVRLQDENNNDVELSNEPGTVWHVEDGEAEFGVLPAGDLSQLKSALDTEHAALSTSTNVPSHVIAGDWPSGEALIQADRPLVDQAEELADNFGPAWASVMHKATEIANAFGKARLNPDALITTIFRPADKSDLLTMSAVASAVAPYVSNEEVLRILRYSPEKIKQIQSEKSDENSFILGTVPGEVPGETEAEKGAADAGEKIAA